MRKKWFKKPETPKLMTKDKAKNSRFFRYFQAPCFWEYDLQHVARGVAAGFASAVIPGVQIFYAGILVVVLRGNLPVAMISTLISNPLTFVPIVYYVSYVGALIMHNGGTQVAFKAFQWDFSSFHAFWANVGAWALQFGTAFFVGMPVVSLVLGIVGYFGTILIWELYLLIRR